MKLPFCPHEEQVAGIVNRNLWPGEANSALLEHARACSRCSEVLFAVEILQTSRASAMMSSQDISSGHLWWRAQLRRKSGAVAQMTRPIVWAEWLAFTGMLCIIAGFAFWQRTEIVDFFSSFIGISILAGLTAILCVGGLTLFLADRKP
jgi:hypothetical protein